MHRIFLQKTLLLGYFRGWCKAVNFRVSTAYFLNGRNQGCFIIIHMYLKIMITKIVITFWGPNFPFYIKSQSPFSKTCVDQLTCTWSCFNFNTSCCCCIYWIKTRVKYTRHISWPVLKVSLANTFKFERQSLLRIFLFLVSHLPLSLLVRSAAKVNSFSC